MNTPPHLTFVQGLECNTLTGWEDRLRWAMHNDPLWRTVFNSALHSGLLESDAVKLLAHAQAARIAELEAQLVRTYQLSLSPIFHDPRVPFGEFKIKVDEARRF